MPTKQYIGAKYAPTFADPITWSATGRYDALTIVEYATDTNQPNMLDTYVSKKAPPIGTVPTNTEYWIKIYDFNAQIAGIRDIAGGAVDTANNALQIAGDAEEIARGAADAAGIAQNLAENLNEQINDPAGIAPTLENVEQRTSINEGEIGDLRHDLGEAQDDITSVTATANRARDDLNNGYDDGGVQKDSVKTQLSDLFNHLEETNDALSAVENIVGNPDDNTGLCGEVDALDDTVNNPTTGLKKQLENMGDNVSTHTGQINALNTTVYTAETGLVDTVARDTLQIQTNTADIEELKGRIISQTAIVTLKACGAVGDGVTDDTAAFEDFIGRTAPIKVIDDGVYLLHNAQININKDIYIFGNNCTLVCAQELNDRIAKIISEDKNNITISGVKFKGYADREIDEEHDSGIELIGFENVTIENCKFYNFAFNNCIHIEGDNDGATTNLCVNECIFDNIGQYYSDMYEDNNPYVISGVCKSTKVENCIFDSITGFIVFCDGTVNVDSCNFYTTSGSVVYNANGDTSIANCYMNNCTSIYYDYNMVENTRKKVKISNNVCENIFYALANPRIGTIHPTPYASSFESSIFIFSSTNSNSRGTFDYGDIEISGNRFSTYNNIGTYNYGDILCSIMKRHKNVVVKNNAILFNTNQSTVGTNDGYTKWFDIGQFSDNVIFDGNYFGGYIYISPIRITPTLTANINDSGVKISCVNNTVENKQTLYTYGRPTSNKTYFLASLITNTVGDYKIDTFVENNNIKNYGLMFIYYADYSIVNCCNNVIHGGELTSAGTAVYINTDNAAHYRAVMTGNMTNNSLTNIPNGSNASGVGIIENNMVNTSLG